MSGQSSSAAAIGVQLAEKALRMINHYAVVSAVAAIAMTGNELNCVRDPDKFINDAEQATWDVLRPRPDWETP